LKDSQIRRIDVFHQYKSPDLPVVTIPEKAWKNGIVVRMPNHLGDAVMALPALYMLKKIVPEYCALFVICPANLKPLFRALPWVDGMILLKNVHKMWSMTEFRSLRNLRMGVGVLFNNSFRDALLMRLAGVSPLYGSNARFRSWLLAKAFDFEPRPHQKLAEIHHTNKYISIARALGAPEWDGKMPRFVIRPSLDEISPDVSSICEHPQLLTLAAGAAYGAAKRWPAESFRTVARYWVRHGGIVAVLGSASEYDVCQDVIKDLSDRKVFNLAGKTSLAEVMHLLNYSVCCVANDSGIMHLSAVLGKPGIAVFGPTDCTATGPINPGWEIIYRPTECSPCFRRECPRGSQRCIKSITPLHVIKLLKKYTIAGRIHLKKRPSAPATQ